MKVLSLTFTLLLFTFFSNAQMIVDDEGDLGIGGSYGTTKFTVPSDYAVEISGKMFVKCGSATGVQFDDYGSDALLYGGFNNGGYLGKFNQRWGNIYTDKINGTTYVTSSDISIKENIRSIENATTKLMLVNPVIYDLKASFFEDSAEDKLSQLVNDNKGTSGVIAQELQEIYPSLVHSDEGSDLLGVNYQGLIPHMIKAIQEQQVVINELQTQLDILQLGK